MKGTLTRKRQAFVTEYLIDLNATQAAVRAGYSAKTAGSQGERLLRIVEVAAAIERGTQERAARLKLSADYVLEGIRRITEQSCDVDSDRFDAKVALKDYELLGKHLKLFTDEVDKTENNTQWQLRIVHVGS
jgi:phage terminase small subunit